MSKRFGICQRTLEGVGRCLSQQTVSWHENFISTARGRLSGGSILLLPAGGY